MESSGEGSAPRNEKVQSEFYFDKTEYHKIMSEAIAAEPPSAFDEDGGDDSVRLIQIPDKLEENRRQTFFVGAFIVGALLLIVGAILFIFA